MTIVYILAGVGALLLLTLIPLPRQRLKNTINKYMYEKDSREEFISKIEGSFLIKMMTPKKDSVRYEKERKKLLKSGIRLSLEKVAIIKVVFFIISFIFIFGVYVNMNTLREKGILEQSDNNNAVTLIMGNTDTDVKGSNSIYDSLLQKTLEKAPNYKTYFKKNKVGELAAIIGDAREELSIQDNKDETARKVLQTLLQAYNMTIISPANVGILLLLALLSTGIIDLIFGFRKSIRIAKIEKEFAKIEAVTILLMNKENINVVSLLQQMKAQSKVLRSNFQQCLNMYTSSPVKALDELVTEVDNSEFTKFITILKQCLNSDKATNNQILKIQRNLRLAMEETVNKQKNRSKRIRLTLLQFPLILLLILLIMLPFFDIIKNTI